MAPIDEIKHAVIDTCDNYDYNRNDDDGPARKWVLFLTIQGFTSSALSGCGENFTRVGSAHEA